MADGDGSTPTSSCPPSRERPTTTAMTAAAMVAMPATSGHPEPRRFLGVLSII